MDGSTDDAPAPEVPELDPELRARLEALCREGWSLFERFDLQVRQDHFHPFVAAEYEVVLEALVRIRRPGLRFLEWGSATGVVSIMADLLGFDAYGIEIDASLVEQARDLARRTGSGARFAAASFIPTGYEWRDPHGDRRMATIASGKSGYLELGLALDDFDVVFGYPWDGEAALMLDLMRAYGRPGASLLLHGNEGVKVYRGGGVAA